MLANARLEENGAIIAVDIPLKLKRRGGRKEIILPSGVVKDKPPTPLQQAIARAFIWQKALDAGTTNVNRQLAELAGVSRAYISRMLRLTLLAPDIVEALLTGTEPAGISLSTLQNLPDLWDEQRKALGFRQRKVDAEPISNKCA